MKKILIVTLMTLLSAPIFGQGVITNNISDDIAQRTRKSLWIEAGFRSAAAASDNLGNMYELGLSYNKMLNRYVGWDIIRVGIGYFRGPSEMEWRGSIYEYMTGVHPYDQFYFFVATGLSAETKRFYANISLGLGLKIGIVPEVGAGVKISKRVRLGLIFGYSNVYNCAKDEDYGSSVGLRLGFSL